MYEHPVWLMLLEQDIYIFDFVVLRLGPEQTKKRDHAEGVPLPLPSLPTSPRVLLLVPLPVLLAVVLSGLEASGVGG